MILTLVDNSIEFMELGDLADSNSQNCLNPPANHSCSKQIYKIILSVDVNVLHCSFFLLLMCIIVDYLDTDHIK